MTETAEEILKRALALGTEVRACLAGALVESLHGEPEQGVEEAWEKEIQRPIAELDARTAKTVPWSEVRERLFHGSG
jgi:putative addiction module component (TIGR02574 family)